MDGGKRWKNEKVAEEKTPATDFGSPSKGQAINLLDTVSDGIIRRTKHLGVPSCRLSKFNSAPSLPGRSCIPQTDSQGAEGLRGHPAAHQELLPHCSQKHPRQV